MTRYACPNPGCPKREPVTAASAPTCYTCGRAMREVAPRPEFVMEPYIYEAGFFNYNQSVPFHDENHNRNEPAPRTYHAADAQIDLRAIAAAPPREIVLHFGDRCLSLHPTSVTPDHDGSAATLRIVAPFAANAFEVLEDWSRARVPVRVDAGPELYAIVERTYEGGSHEAGTMTLLLKQIQLAGMTVQQRAAVERSVSTPSAAPPYAVGDEVEWRTGPLHTGWEAGRVTSIIDDRPNDGIDKPFWIVRVDTAGERRFAGPALAVCLRRRAARNEAGVIIDRAFCEPYERMGSYLTTAWRCRHCNRDVFSYALASAVIQPSTCCGAPAEQIRLADAGTFTET